MAHTIAIELHPALVEVEQAAHAVALPQNLQNIPRSARSTPMKRGMIASPFERFDLCLKKVFHPKLKSVCSQLVDFVRVTGFRRPNAEIAKAIAARCAMFASFALAEANRLDDEEVSEKTSAWKEWLAMANLASAAIGHRYTKVPLS